MIFMRSGTRVLQRWSSIPHLSRTCQHVRRTASKRSNTLPPVAPHISAPTGIAAGTLGALCGIGGGLVIMPVLKQFTRLSVHHITATSLCSITIASCVGAASYISQGVADVPASILLASSAILTSGLGAKMNHRLPAATLTKLLAITMIGSIPFVLNKPMREERKAKDETAHQVKISDAGGRDFKFFLGNRGPDSWASFPEWFSKNCHYLAVGSIVGFASALLGVGGGIVMTTYMGVATDMTQHEAVATSLVAMVPTGFSATFWHMRAGNVHVRAAMVLGTSCAIAMYATAVHVAPYCSEETMRRIFSLLLAVSAGRMLL